VRAPHGQQLGQQRVVRAAHQGERKVGKERGLGPLERVGRAPAAVPGLRAGLAGARLVPARSRQDRVGIAILRPPSSPAARLGAQLCRDVPATEARSGALSQRLSLWPSFIACKIASLHQTLGALRRARAWAGARPWPARAGQSPAGRPGRALPQGPFPPRRPAAAAPRSPGAAMRIPKVLTCFKQDCAVYGARCCRR